MEATMKPLNLNDEWEEIVNANRDTKQKNISHNHRRKMIKRVFKIAVSALFFAAAAILFFIAAPKWYAVSTILACISSFQIGRFWEIWNK